MESSFMHLHDKIGKIFKLAFVVLKWFIATDVLSPPKCSINQSNLQRTIKLDI